MLISIVDDNPLIDGVNDAVIETNIGFGRARDETSSGRGKTWIEIIESGWACIPGTKSLALAMSALG